MPMCILPRAVASAAGPLPRRDIAACLLPLLSAGTDFLVGPGEFVELDLRQILYINHFVFCFVYRVDQFVQFQMYGPGIAILRILNQEHHQECNDRGTGINDQLPGIGVMEDRTCESPDYNDPNRNAKGPSRAEIV